MDLAARGAARQRNNCVMRLGAALVSLALAFSLVIQPPRAKAFAAVGQLYTVVSAFMASCGLSWGVQGMDETGFGDQVAKLLQDYLDTEFAGQTPLEWAGDFTAIATPQGKLQIPKLLVEKFSAFANWTIEKLGIKAGGSVSITGNLVTFSDGSVVQLGDYLDLSVPFTDLYAGRDFPFTLQITDTIAFTFSLRSNGFLELRTSDGKSTYIDTVFDPAAKIGVYLLRSTREILNIFVAFPGSVSARQTRTAFDTGVYMTDLGLVGVSINAATAIDVPDASTMADDEALEIGVGAAAGVALDVLLQQILDAILAGNLAATQEIAKAEEVTKPGEITDVDGLGLPALGAALTTRFPFSIPWDVVRGIKLLAAPAEAPYWKVDFMAPLAGRVGGWKGDTTIEIDMGKYPLIGQLCRWTSTIGFCLLLASGTKRLIWTA